MRRALAFAAVTSLATAALAAGIFVASSGAAKQRPSSAVTKVTVTATEFHFRLSRTSIAGPGKVAFRVVNKGKIGHDFKIAGKKTTLLAPGKSQTIVVAFRKAGRYRYLCTVPGHAKLGMKGTFVVRSKGAAVTHVKVVASEFRFTLSRRSLPAPGRVVNRGKIDHDFKIAGHKTRLLAPGKSQKLTVSLRAGSYRYLCTVPGHARLGMKGTFTVGRASVSTTTPTSTTTTTTTTTTSTTVAGPATTVTVDMREYAFDLSQTTVPHGEVTFVIKNVGTEPHNFDLAGVKAGAILGPGQSETWTVGLLPKTYEYLCDVPFHADRGMVGSLTVT
jgi:uncharacterized cupredoxin-like copper-binding protein